MNDVHEVPSVVTDRQLPLQCMCRLMSVIRVSDHFQLTNLMYVYMPEYSAYSGSEVVQEKHSQAFT